MLSAAGEGIGGDDGPAIALYARLGVGEDVLHVDIAPAGTDP